MSKNLKSKKSVAVLGVGRVGKAIALDLARDYQVVAIDSNADNLKQIKSKQIKVIKANIGDSSKISSITSRSELVVVALPGFLAFNVVKKLIELGKNVVDISFFSEDPFKLDSLAKKNKVKVLVDCGVAPGLSNIILGYHYERMKVEKYLCYVGGLPKLRIWPYQYKAAWSPIDVIEEYVRPARQIENGVIIKKPALSDLELITFENLGTFEAFNTDGLRTLLKTVAVKDMKEKTLRYPGHAEYMQVLRQTGYFSKKLIDVDGHKIKPIDFTSHLLFPHWKLAVGEDEFTIMRVIIEGKEKNKSTRYVYDLFDQYDKKSGLTSMSRVTGYTCSAIARLVLEGEIKNTGLVVPEELGKEEIIFKYILRFLQSKGIKLKIKKPLRNNQN